MTPTPSWVEPSRPPSRVPPHQPGHTPRRRGAGLHRALAVATAVVSPQGAARDLCLDLSQPGGHDGQDGTTFVVRHDSWPGTPSRVAESINSAVSSPSRPVGLPFILWNLEGTARPRENSPCFAPHFSGIRGGWVISRGRGQFVLQCFVSPGCCGGAGDAGDDVVERSSQFWPRP
jgi:hypothetical protein